MAAFVDELAVFRTKLAWLSRAGARIESSADYHVLVLRLLDLMLTRSRGTSIVRYIAAGCWDVAAGSSADFGIPR